VGPRGLAVLSVAGVAGVVLGLHGWSQRPTYLAAPVTAAPVIVPAASASPSASANRAATSTAAGPQLSSMPYASFAYQVWPAPISADGKRALSGWTLTVTPRHGGILVKAALNGQAMSSVSHFYPGGAKVYILDSALGQSTETSEGLEVTNAQGQVLP
jgi:hypothetical protein